MSWITRHLVGATEHGAVLALAAKYALTGYDAQNIALAQSLHVTLNTEDRKLKETVPRIAFSM